MSLTAFYDRIQKRPQAGDKIVLPEGCCKTVQSVDLKHESITAACETPKVCTRKVCDLSQATLFRNGRKLS
jgi:hypothetical protein